MFEGKDYSAVDMVSQFAVAFINLTTECPDDPKITMFPTIYLDLAD